jgi:hypothetical protein
MVVGTCTMIAKEEEKMGMTKHPHVRRMKDDSYAAIVVRG